MRIAEAIRFARKRRDTELPNEILVQWLSALDGEIWQEIVRHYPDAGTMPVYNDETDLEGTSLMIDAPWDDLYVDYLAMRIDLDHGEIERYNNCADMFNQRLQSWANWYNRNHRWTGTAPTQCGEARYRTEIRF